MRTALRWALGNLLVGALVLGGVLVVESKGYSVDALALLAVVGAVVGFGYWLVAGVCFRRRPLPGRLIVHLLIGNCAAVLGALSVLFLIMKVLDR